MKILTVFDSKNSGHSIKPLDDTELAQLEALLVEREGRLWTCRVFMPL